MSQFTSLILEVISTLFQWFTHFKSIAALHKTHQRFPGHSARAARPLLRDALVVLLCFLTIRDSPAAQTPLCTQPPSGLVDWWSGEGNGNDTKGNSNASLQGDVTFAPGEVGVAFTFNGAGAVSFPSAGTIGTSDFTIDFWLKTTSFNTQGILGKRSGCTHNHFYDIRTLSNADEGGGHAGHLLIELDQGDGINYTAIITARAITDGMFHHVAVVRQNVTVFVYIDGVVDSLGSTPAVVDVSNGGTLTAGQSACNGAFPNVPLVGQLDEIDLFNRALAASEIQAIFDAGAAGKCNVSTAPTSSRAYVVNAGSNSVTVINTATNTVLATVPVGPDPVQVAVTPDGTAYVTNAEANSVSVFNTSTNLVIATIPVGRNPTHVAVTPDGTKAYVTNTGANSVSVINTSTNLVIATVSVGRNPISVAITSDGTTAYVTNTGANSVSVINTATNSLLATLPVGLIPVDVVLH